MSRIDLPITDYVGDQTSVLDQAIRIMQASIDILTELGYLSSCLQMMRLMQCIKCARWPTDAPASILPGVEPESIKGRDASRKDQRLETATGQPICQDPPASHLASKSRFVRAVSILPNISVSVPQRDRPLPYSIAEAAQPTRRPQRAHLRAQVPQATERGLVCHRRGRAAGRGNCRQASRVVRCGRQATWRGGVLRRPGR